MRIIAGRFRGRKLQAPEGSGTRPTADRVRETLFSMLASRIGSFEDLRVADLYAGTGALGLEALSRGAAHATFVEADSRAAAALRANATSLGVADLVRLIAGSATALPGNEAFDLIFADPPYRSGAGSQVAQSVAEADWLSPGGWMAVETQRGDGVEPPDGWALETERDVGRARITLLYRP